LTELGVTRFEHESNRIHATLKGNGANLIERLLALFHFERMAFPGGQDLNPREVALR
jgi:hypothetical protein